jgi:KaiC/GvpD/RAD55 family RecA-like ATPase
MYDLGPSIPLEEFRHVDPGTRLLVVGPPGTDARGVALELLAAGQRRADGVLVVSTAIGAEPFTAAYEAAGGAVDDRLHVVDATGFGSDDDGVTAVDTPTDLAGVGTAVNRALERYVTLDTEGLRLGHLSATAMLDHMDRGSVYKFLRTLMDRVERAGYLGVSTVDSEQVNEQTVAMFADAFDAVLELREGPDGVELRVSAPDLPGGWRPLGE